MRLCSEPELCPKNVSDPDAIFPAAWTTGPGVIWENSVRSPLDVFEYPNSELVIAFVAATGTNTDPAQSAVENYLKKLGYTVPQPIRLSKMLKAVKERLGLRSELSDAN